VFVNAALELAVEVELELFVAVEPAEVVPVLVPDPAPLEVDKVVATVGFVLLVPVADVELELAEAWAKTPPVEEELVLEVTEDEAEAEEETALPLQEPDTLILW